MADQWITLEKQIEWIAAMRTQLDHAPTAA